MPGKMVCFTTHHQVGIVRQKGVNPAIVRDPEAKVTLSTLHEPANQPNEVATWTNFATIQLCKVVSDRELAAMGR